MNRVNIMEKIENIVRGQRDEVIGLKLTTGEYIIGSLGRSPHSGSIKDLIKPTSVLSNGQGIVFMPWVFSSDDSFSLADILPFVILAASVPESLSEAYLNQTGQRKVALPASARGDNRILVN